MQNIFEQFFNKDKDKNMTGLPFFADSQICSYNQLLFIALYFQIIKINPIIILANTWIHSLKTKNLQNFDCQILQGMNALS